MQVIGDSSPVPNIDSTFFAFYRLNLNPGISLLPTIEGDRDAKKRDNESEVLVALPACHTYVSAALLWKCR